MVKRLKPFFRNFYVVSTLVFLLWMTFLDSNDLFYRFRLSAKLNSLEREKAHYLEKIEEVRKDRDELLGNPRLLEKYAREKYLMKKETEDIYVVVEE